MAIPEHIVGMFENIRSDGDGEHHIGLLEAVDSRTQAKRYLICVFEYVGDEVQMLPVGEVFDPERVDLVMAECDPPDGAIEEDRRDIQN